MTFHYVVTCIQFIPYNKKSIEVYLYLIVYFAPVYKLVLFKDFKNAKIRETKGH